MKIGFNLSVVLALSRLLEDHLKYRTLEPEIELHLEGDEEGEGVILTVLTPGCHWNVLLDAQAWVQLVEELTPSSLKQSGEELSREGGPEQLARVVFERIKARLPLTTYTPRP